MFIILNFCGSSDFNVLNKLEKKDGEKLLYIYVQFIGYKRCLNEGSLDFNKQLY